MNVQVPALAENRHHRSFGRDQRVDAGVLFHRVACQTGRAERRQPGMLQLHSLGAREELLVLGIRPWPAALNVVNTQLVQLVDDEDLVVRREADGLALGAVAQAWYRT